MPALPGARAGEEQYGRAPKRSRTGAGIVAERNLSHVATEQARPRRRSAALAPPAASRSCPHEAQKLTRRSLRLQRRRDRINERFAALRVLVPHTGKTDKATFLGEVIDYVKTLQMYVNYALQHAPPAPGGVAPQQAPPQQLRFAVPAVAPAGEEAGPHTPPVQSPTARWV